MADLINELGAAEARLTSLQSRLAEVEREVALEGERVSLLRRLLELDGAKPRHSASDARTRKNAPLSAHIAKLASNVRLEDAVVSMLSDRPEAVHIGEIRSKLIERGIRIPGKGTDSNIIARLIKEPRIERQRGRRGFYRLRQA